MAVGTGYPLKPEVGNAVASPQGVLDGDKLTNAADWQKIAAAGATIAEGAAKSIAYDVHQQQVGYYADQENDIRRKRTDLSNEFYDQPDKFDAAWKGYSAGKLGEAPGWAQQKLRSALGSEGNSGYAGTLAHHRTKMVSQATDSWQISVNNADKDVVAASMAGTLLSTDSEGLHRDPRIIKYQGVLASGVASGFITQERADAALADLTDRTIATTVVREIGDEYKAARANGEVAARHALQVAEDRILRNPELRLDEAKRYGYYSRAKGEIQAQEAERKQDLALARSAANDLKLGLAAGVMPDQQVLGGLVSQLNAAGGQAVAADLLGAVERARVLGPFGSLPIREQTRIYREYTGITNAARVSAEWGDPDAPDFAAKNITTITTPSGKSLQVHRNAATAFQGFLAELEATGYKITSIGGHNNRNIAGTDKKSQHAWGNAIDINPYGEGNAFSANLQTNLPANVSEMAARHGLSWGGDWKGKKDAMHFEYVGAPAAASSATAQGAAPTSPTEAGNIDLGSRPRVQMPDGSTATVRSIGVNVDGQEVLIPTVSDDGRVMTQDEAVEQYKKTGKHLGKFKSVEDATAYAKWLSAQEGRRVSGVPSAPAGAAPTYTPGRDYRMIAAMQGTIAKQARADWAILEKDFDAGIRPPAALLDATIEAAKVGGDHMLLAKIERRTEIQDHKEAAGLTSVPQQQAGLTALEREGALGNLEPGYGKILQNLEAQINATIKGLEDEPVSHTVGKYPERFGAPKPLNPSDSKTFRDGLAYRAQITRFAEQNFQTGKALTAIDKNDMGPVKAILESGSYKDQARVYADMAASLPPDVYDATIRKLGGDNFQQLVGRLAIQQPDIARNILFGKDLMKTKEVSDKASLVRPALEAKLGGQLYPSVAEQSAVVEAALSLYTQRRGSAFALYSATDTAAIGKAIEDITGPIVRRNGQQLPIAPGIPRGAFIAALDGLTNAELTYNGGAVDKAGRSLSGPFVGQNAVLKPREVGSSTYFVGMPDPSSHDNFMPLLTGDGFPLVFDMAQMSSRRPNNPIPNSPYQERRATMRSEDDRRYKQQLDDARLAREAAEQGGQ